MELSKEKVSFSYNKKKHLTINYFMLIVKYEKINFIQSYRRESISNEELNFSAFYQFVPNLIANDNLSALLNKNISRINRTNLTKCD